MTPVPCCPLICLTVVYIVVYIVVLRCIAAATRGYALKCKAAAGNPLFSFFFRHKRENVKGYSNITMKFTFPVRWSMKTFGHTQKRAATIWMSSHESAFTLVSCYVFKWFAKRQFWDYSALHIATYVRYNYRLYVHSFWGDWVTFALNRQPEGFVRFDKASPKMIR